MLVDPSTGMIDFSRDKFDFSNELWLKLQNREINVDKYAFPGRYSGFVSIVGKISPDIAFLLGTEYPVYQFSPILDYAFKNKDQITAENIKTLNEICELMKSINYKNLKKLYHIYNNTPQIQISKTFSKKTK